MEILQIVGLAIIGSGIIVMLNHYNKDFGLYIRIAIGIIIFIFIFSKLGIAFNILNEIIQKTQLSNEYIKILLKVIGIAYISEFGSQICKDVNELAIATKIEFAGKILIMLVAVPIVAAILNEVSNFFI